MPWWVVYVGGQPFARLDDKQAAEEYADIWRCSFRWENDSREVIVGMVMTPNEVQATGYSEE